MAGRVVARGHFTSESAAQPMTLRNHTALQLATRTPMTAVQVTSEGTPAGRADDRSIDAVDDFGTMVIWCDDGLGAPISTRTASASAVEFAPTFCTWHATAR